MNYKFFGKSRKHEDSKAFAKQEINNSVFNNLQVGEHNALNPCTELCVDVKTHLVSDGRTVLGKRYHGSLTRDGESHFNFVESTSVAHVRNPRVYEGTYVNVTRNDKGELSLNFRRSGYIAGDSIRVYALNVYYEVVQALTGLLEK